MEKRRMGIGFADNYRLKQFFQGLLAHKHRVIVALGREYCFGGFEVIQGGIEPEFNCFFLRHFILP
jgi:hypothetical protein